MLYSPRTWMRAGVLLALCSAAPALAQSDPTFSNDDNLPCSDATATIHAVTPELGYNDFDGTGQQIYGIGYSRASCLAAGGSTRWHLELNAAHVEQRGFRAQAAIAGVGLSLHPFAKRPDFTLFPIVRAGFENIARGPDNFVFGGGLAIADAIPLDPRRAVPASGPLLVLNARIDYTDRRSSDRFINLATPRSGRTDLSASAAIDMPASGAWRMRGWAGYHRLDSDYLKGFATIGVSARPQAADDLTYGWNVSLSGNFGERNYRGLVLSVTRRFLGARRP